MPSDSYRGESPDKRRNEVVNNRNRSTVFSLEPLPHGAERLAGRQLKQNTREIVEARLGFEPELLIDYT